MEEPYFKVKRVREEAKLPSKREEDAGYDVYGVFEQDPVFLYPGEILTVPLGIKTQFPKNYVFYIVERSGPGAKGLATRAGVIDSGYRGEILTPINNTTNKLIIFSDKEEKDLWTSYKDVLEAYEDNYIVHPQSKAIAQGLFLYSPHVEVEETEEFEESDRGEGGFGSTSK